MWPAHQPMGFHGAGNWRVPATSPSIGTQPNRSRTDSIPPPPGSQFARNWSVHATSQGIGTISNRSRWMGTPNRDHTNPLTNWLIGTRIVTPGRHQPSEFWTEKVGPAHSNHVGGPRNLPAPTIHRPSFTTTSVDCTEDANTDRTVTVAIGPSSSLLVDGFEDNGTQPEVTDVRDPVKNRSPLHERNPVGCVLALPDEDAAPALDNPSVDLCAARNRRKVSSTPPNVSVEQQTTVSLPEVGTKRGNPGDELRQIIRIWRCPASDCGWTTREKQYLPPQCRWCKKASFCVPFDETLVIGREARKLLEAAQSLPFEESATVEINDALMDRVRRWAHKRSAQARHEKLQQDPRVAALLKKKRSKRMTEEAAAYHPSTAGLDMNGINCYYCSSSPADQLAASMSSQLLEENSTKDVEQAVRKDHQERLLELALGCCRECRYHCAESGATLRNSALRARLRYMLAREEATDNAKEEDNGANGKDSGDSSSDEEMDDWQDTAYNQTDENRIRKHQQLTYLGSVISRYQSRKSQMKDWFGNWQAYDDDPATMDAGNRWCLWAFPPKDKTISTMALLSDADLEDKNWIQRKWGTPYRVERAPTQVCLNYDFHNTVHLSMGPSGSQGLVQYFRSMGRGSIKTFASDRDHTSAPPYPTICNLYERKVPHPNGGKEVPLLQLVDEYINKHISTLVKETLVWNKKDHRNQKFVLHLGFTAQRADGWSRALCFGPAEPGLVGDDLPEGLKQVWADWGWLATGVCMRSLLGEAYKDYIPAHEERKKYARRLAEFLGLPPELWEEFLAEHMTIAIGHLVAAHTDYLNCTRRGHNWLLTIRKVVDLSDRADEIPGLREWAKKFGIDLRAVVITFIVYCRSICGAKADLARLGLNIEEPVAKALYSFLERVINGEPGYKCYLDVDCLVLHDDPLKDRSATAFRNELWDSFSQHDINQPRARKEYPGPKLRRPEGITKYFFFASFAHATWKPLVTIPALQTYGSLLQLAVWAATETNGQELYHTIIFKWLSGNYLRGTGTFLSAFGKTQDLFLMASREAFYLSDENGWVSSLNPRHQQSHILRTHDRIPVVDPKTGLPKLNEKTGKNEWHYFERPDAAEISRQFVGEISDIVEGAISQESSPQQIYDLLVGSGISHIGHLTAMHVIELFALLGILPFHFFFFATVASKGKYGTSLFIAQHAGLDLIDEQEESNTKQTNTAQANCQLDAEYRSIFANTIKVLESLKFRCEPLFAEQPMCLIHRHENNTVKWDLLFCDSDPKDWGLLQLFFNLVRIEKEPRVCYYSFKENRWIDFFSTMAMRPVFSWKERPGIHSSLEIKGRSLPDRPHWKDLRHLATN